MHTSIYFVILILYFCELWPFGTYDPNTFTFNVVITHEIIPFKDICMDKIPKDFTSVKDTYAALMVLHHLNRLYTELYLVFPHGKANV